MSENTEQFKITESVGQIKKFIYDQRNDDLQSKFDFKTFKENTDTTLTCSQFSQCIKFLIKDGYVGILTEPGFGRVQLSSHLCP